MITQVFQGPIFLPGRANRQGVKYFGRLMVSFCQTWFRYRRASARERLDSSPELDSLNCHAQFSAIRIITMPNYCQNSQILPSFSIRLFGWGSYPFECLGSALKLGRYSGLANQAMPPGLRSGTAKASGDS